MENIYSNEPFNPKNKYDVEMHEMYETISQKEGLPTETVNSTKSMNENSPKEDLPTLSIQQSEQHSRRVDITWCRIVLAILLSSTFIVIIQIVATVLVIQWNFENDMPGVANSTLINTTIPENTESQLKECGQPQDVANSRYLMTGNTSGSVIMYACNEGYYLDGIPVVYCKPGGQLSSIRFSCIKDCGQPPIIPFARTYVTSTHVGSVVRYKCLDGFYSIGNPSSRCQSYGNWTSNRFECLNTQLRLDGGYNNTRGRVEINYFGVWGTVCDDDWEDIDAKVVCKQLGFRSGISKKEAYFGRGTGQIWMDNVNCSGSESRLEECTFNGWGKENCAHYEDAGVICIKT